MNSLQTNSMALWQPRKRLIKELYINQRKTLDELRRIMEIEHNFKASKREYERQLKLWNFKKNIDQNIIMFIKVQLDALRQQVKESDVYLKGVLIPKHEVHKKIGRCNVPVMKGLQLQRSRMPAGLVIIAPAPDSYMDYVRTIELPWLYFVSQLDKIDNFHAILSMPQDMLRDLLPAFCPSPSTLVPVHLRQLVHQFSIVLPLEHDGKIIDLLRKMFCGDYQIATVEFLKLAVYVLSNKLLRRNESIAFCNKLLKWFQMGSNYRFLQEILSHKTPIIEAFMEGVFCSAVYDEDEFFLKIFLQSGVDPNIIISDPHPAPRLRPNCCPLDYFARYGNLRLAKMVLDLGVDVNFDYGGPLRGAAAFGNIEVANLLIERNAVIDMVEPGNDFVSDCTALQHAASRGHLDMAKLLLDNGANINATSSRFWGCPLSIAINFGATNLVEMLLDRNADVNCHWGGECSTALQAAARRGNHALTKRLLGLGANPNPLLGKVNAINPYVPWAGGSKTALQWASEIGSLEMCETLIQHGAEINAAPRYRGGTTVLADAVRSENHDLVGFLLRKGADPNDKRGECTALEEAIALHDMKTITLLLAAGADPSNDNSIVQAIGLRNLNLVQTLMIAAMGVEVSKVLCAAIGTGDVEFIQRVFGLLDASSNSTTSCDLNAIPMTYSNDDMSLIKYWVVELKDTKLVRSFVRNYTDAHVPRAERTSDLTALQAATLERRIDRVHMLLETGTDPNDVFSLDYGRSSLQIAAGDGDNRLVQLLLDHGANINWQGTSEFSRTALQWACGHGHYLTVQLLIEKGADVNAPASRRGSNALQTATACGYLQIAKILLDAGAFVDALGGEDFPHWTALVWAARKGRIDILKLLLNAGADITTERGRSRLKYAMGEAKGAGNNAVAKFLKYHQTLERSYTT
ncbi:Ankyrin repeat-containing domain protein [Hyaloscypha variabilis]